MVSRMKREHAFGVADIMLRAISEASESKSAHGHIIVGPLPNRTFSTKPIIENDERTITIRDIDTADAYDLAYKFAFDAIKWADDALKHRLDIFKSWIGDSGKKYGDCDEVKFVKDNYMNWIHLEISLHLIDLDNNSIPYIPNAQREFIKNSLNRAQKQCDNQLYYLLLRCSLLFCVSNSRICGETLDEYAARKSE